MYSNSKSTLEVRRTGKDVVPGSNYLASDNPRKNHWHWFCVLRPPRMVSWRDELLLYRVEGEFE